MSMTTKQALDAAMSAAAGYSNRCKVLRDLSQFMPEHQFERVAGQHPDTLERDVASAEAEFQRLKAAYEAHCAEIGEPAYATYNED